MTQGLGDIVGNLKREILALSSNSSLSISQKHAALQAVFSTVLEGMGYNNYQNMQRTGEEGFIKGVLSRLDPKVSLDIGANCGSYSSLLLLHTNSVVHAFEPLEVPFAKLATIGYEQNARERLIAVNKAVSNHTGSAVINYNPDSTSFASLSDDINAISYVDNSSRKHVQVTSVDEYVNGGSVDFIKIDTEGFELEVLQGAKRTIAGEGSSPPLAIQIEFNLHHLFRGHSLLRLSQELSGYTPFQLLPGGDLIQRDPSSPASNIFAFSNFVFIRSDLIIKRM